MTIADIAHLMKKMTKTTYLEAVAYRSVLWYSNGEMETSIVVTRIIQRVVTTNHPPEVYGMEIEAFCQSTFVCRY